MTLQPADSTDATFALGAGAGGLRLPESGAEAEATEGSGGGSVPRSSSHGQSAKSRRRAAAQPSLPVGADRYVTESELGRGGWGAVLRVQDRQLWRSVALKQIGSQLAGDPEIQARFLHEATVTGQLQHPSIVPVHEMGMTDQGAPFYVMKLLEGSTFKQVIAKVHSTPEKLAGGYSVELLNRFMDVCNAIAYAHQQGVVHRDLKPANIMAGQFGETVVVDWGLAKRLPGCDRRQGEPWPDETTVGQPPGAHAPAEHSLEPSRPSSSGASTQHGAVLGTPAYMSPEQSKGETDAINESTDVYALGVILYEVLTGSNPFRSGDVSTTLTRVRSGDYAPPREVNRRVPRALAAICTTAMAKNPDDRYASADRIVADLERFLAGDAVSVHQEPWCVKALRWCKRRPALTAGALGSVLVLTVSSILFGAVISKAHHAERQARLAAQAAHDQAVERLADARQAGDAWLINLSGALQFYPGMEGLREELLVEAIAHYGRLSKETGADAHNSQLERAKCQLRLGDLYRLSDRTQESTESYQHALAILAGLGDAEACEAAADVRIQRINARIGLLLLAALEDQPHAVTVDEEAEWLRTRLAEAEHRLADDAVATTANTLARLLLARAQSGSEEADQRVRWLREAEERARGVIQSRGEPRDHKLLQAIRDQLAPVLQQSGALEELARLWASEVDRLGQPAGELQTRPDLLQSRAYARMKLASAQSILGRDRLSRDAHTHAIADLHQAWRATDSGAFYRRNVAISEANLGLLAAERHGDTDVAMRHLYDAVAWLREAVSNDTAAPSDLERLAECYEAMGRIAIRLESDEALTAFDAADRCYTVLADHHQLDTLRTAKQTRLYIARAKLLIQLDDLPAAQADVEQAGRWLAAAAEGDGALSAAGQAWVDRLSPELLAAEALLLETQGHVEEAATKRNLVLERLRKLADTELSENSSGVYPSATQLLVDRLLESGEPADARLSEARAWLAKIQTAAPACRESSAWQQRHALAERLAGNQRSARQAIERALELDPEDSVSQLLHAVLLQEEGTSMAPSGEEFARQALARTPGDDRLRFWARRLLEQGEAATSPVVP